VSLNVVTHRRSERFNVYISRCLNILLSQARRRKVVTHEKHIEHDIKDRSIPATPRVANFNRFSPIRNLDSLGPRMGTIAPWFKLINVEGILKLFSRRVPSVHASSASGVLAKRDPIRGASVQRSRRGVAESAGMRESFPFSNARLTFLSFPYQGRSAHASAIEKAIAAKIPRGSNAAIFRLSVATVAGNIHAVGRYQTPVWPTGYTAVVIRHRGKHTRYTHPRGLPPSLSLSLSPATFTRFPPPCSLHRTRVRRMPVYTRNAKYLSLSGLRRALDLPQHIEHTPDFLSADRAKERRGHIDSEGRKEEKTLFTMRGYIRDISRPLSATVSVRFIRIRTCSCVPTWGKGKISALPRASSLSSLSFPRFITIPDSCRSLHPPSVPWAREVERPFEICRWPKDRASRTALRPASNPRFLSFNWKLAERCYRTTLAFDVVNSAATAKPPAWRLCIRRLTTKFSHCSNFLRSLLSLSLCSSVRVCLSVYLRLCLCPCWLLSRFCSLLHLCKMYIPVCSTCQTLPEIFPRHWDSFFFFFPPCFFFYWKKSLLSCEFWYGGKKELRYITRFSENF